ncbi:acyl-CoA dehydrogenase family protein [Streptomyces spectabilis]|uniref:acyl-CoA dehydrogenase family protein n=1 Tax=Streptomyces spectabilis TaxID=68270 RepID=UPI0033F3579F
MHFQFSDDQHALAKRVRAFVSGQVAPFATEHDRTGTFPAGYFARFAEEGLFGLGIPVEYDGQGLDAVSVGVALEEVARGEPAACHPVLNATLIGSILSQNGTDAQQAAYLPLMARGEAVVALCLTEPDHGTDAGGIEFEATPDGDGWRLSGTKTSIMVGAYATHGLVFARTEDTGSRGVTAFFVSLDQPGVRRERLRDLGHRAGGRATLVFDDVAVGPEHRIGAAGEGLAKVLSGFSYSRALIALNAVAAAQVALDEAFAHARERVAFGKPLGAFQGVTFPLVEHATYLKAARLLAFEALWRKDQGLEHRVEANMVKSWAPKAAVDAIHQALLTLGHLGWSVDRPMERRLRDAIGLQLADGTANATKLAVARELLGRAYAP